ncbi:MAG: molybdenum cofactor guanylyltransferase [Actinobacteria bacterium]|nr:molybdenum cofactor guanylyltransferase [Actinomycetota bacterium]
MSISKNNLSGIILAGGKSRRFGFNKIEVKIGKIPLFIDQVFKLSDFCNEVLIITSEKNRKFITSELSNINAYSKYYPFSGLTGMEIAKVINDERFCSSGLLIPEQAAGPIMGLYTGLKNACGKYSIVLAFDMPFISKKLLSVLAGGLAKEGATPGIDARIIKTVKGFEVLCGFYNASCLKYLENNIVKNRYKISEIFDYIKIEIVGQEELDENKIDSLNFFNINSVEDYYKFIDIWNNNKPQTTGNKINESLNKQFIKNWERFYLR